jgi:hypothetical protein
VVSVVVVVVVGGGVVVVVVVVGGGVVVVVVVVGGGVVVVVVVVGGGGAVGGGGGGGETTAGVGSEVATVDPFLLVAMTVTRNALPTSATRGVKVSPVASEIAEQVPLDSHRFHWNPCCTAGPSHEPACATSVCPSTAVPSIDGADELTGALWPGAWSGGLALAMVAVATKTAMTRL